MCIMYIDIFLEVGGTMKDIISLLLFSVFTSTVATAAPVKDEISCMARTIHWEARGESYKGKLGIAGVIINRKNHEEFPNTICEVVYQTKPIQFSKELIKGTAVRLKDKKTVESWKESLQIAEKVVRNEIKISPQFTALYFDKKSVKVSNKLKLHSSIGNHKFYL